MARRTIVWAEAAWADVDQIGDHIARDSVYYAGAFMRELRDASRSLTELAHRGRVVPEIRDDHVRELIVGNYRLIYEICPQQVQVLGVVHGARDLDRLWRRRTQT